MSDDQWLKKARPTQPPADEVPMPAPVDLDAEGPSNLVGIILLLGFLLFLLLLLIDLCTR